jgi:hypothetical protein
MGEVFKAQNRVPYTPGTYDPIAELVSSVAENAQTKGRTVRMVGAVGAVAGTCIGTAGAACGSALQLGTEYIRGEIEDAQGAEEGVTTQNDTLVPGPFAGDSIPARGPERDFTGEERRAVNDIGNSTGCHTCGTKNPGTKGGNWIPDHQPANQLNQGGGSQRLYPQCVNCSRRQGGQVTQAVRRFAQRIRK